MSYQRQAILRLRDDIRDVTIGASSDNRQRLSNVYHMAMVTESFFPKKPVSFQAIMVTNLRKKVSSSCPACVKPDKMKEYVNQAKRTLKEYDKTLTDWLDETPEVSASTVTSIHDLKSTL